MGPSKIKSEYRIFRSPASHILTWTYLNRMGGGGVVHMNWNVEDSSKRLYNQKGT